MPCSLNRSASNFGNWPVPYKLAELTMNGGSTSLYPCSLRMHVQHEVDQRALQLRSQAPIHREARAGDLRRALEIQNPQLRSQIPMRLRLEIELAAACPSAGPRRYLPRSCPVGTDSCGVFGTPAIISRNASSSVVRLSGRARAIRSPISRTRCCRSVASCAGLPQLPDFLRFGVLLRFELLGFGQRRAPLRIQLAERLDVERESAIRQPLGDGIQIVSKKERSYIAIATARRSAPTVCPTGSPV